MAKGLTRVPVREQDPKVRATNFDEVCLGYNKEEAMEEASRCLNCKNAKCITGCPVNIDIPGFISQVKEGNIEEALTRFPSENWSVSLRTGRKRTGSNRLLPRKRTDTKSLSSVPVLQALPVPAIWHVWAMT